MKSIIKVLITMVTLATLSGPAHAIMFEPYAGMEFGEIGSTASTYEGTTIGARLGFDLIPMFTVGVDYSIGNHTSKDISGDTDVTATDLGIFAMFEFPVLIRVWANYVIDAKLSVPGSSDFEGTATKLGVGYTGLPFVSLNFEMVSRTYTNTTPSDVTSDTYFVSVGIPLP